MEDFAAKENKKIKEKNLYILQLDTPRIIIITSVFFGLLVIAVLIGINFNKTENEKEIFAEDSTIYDDLLTEKDKPAPFEKNMIDPSLGSAGSSMSDGNPDDPSFRSPGNDSASANSLLNEPEISADNIIKPDKNTLAANDNIKSAEPADILTHENIESIIPPSKVLKNRTESKTAPRKKTVKKHKTERKKDVIEVSSIKRITRTPSADKEYFAVQVASYDKKSRALSEVKKLEQKKYNAFIDSASVNGKTFYRVRIGPVYSKKKACTLLDEITANERYEESYLIKN
ncbi:MAG: SPOR domain-containing protein [Spirochaetes bacterium]|nr:SPOR domain-containing protein [Spirochaetota bacterium]